jgi:pimeloyl-ACP methyl ester carboxylesterase
MRGAIDRLANCENWRRWGLEKWMAREHLAQGGPEAWKDVIARVAALVDPAKPDASLSLEDLRRIRARTLLICGDRDELAPLDDVVDMVRAVPESALWVAPQAAHILGVETWRKAAFEEEVRRFLLRG